MRFPQVQARHVLVTGCSSGIGRATARALKARGWRVVPTARKAEDLEHLRTEGFSPVRLDLADSSSVAEAAQEALRLLGGQLGGLVNNAGYGQPGALEDLSREQMRQQFEVNVFGLQELTNRLLPVFLRQGWGRIVNVSSVVGRVPIPFSGAYVASKFAVEALSDVLRAELRGTGIGVSIIEPGPIATRFYERAAEEGNVLLANAASRFVGHYRRALSPEAVTRRAQARLAAAPEAVARKIIHALESPRPRGRYPVTLVARLAPFLRALLPDQAWDALVLWRARTK